MQGFSAETMTEQLSHVAFPHPCRPLDARGDHDDLSETIRTGQNVGTAGQQVTIVTRYPPRVPSRPNWDLHD
jgi:hypothetical protein